MSKYNKPMPTTEYETILGLLAAGGSATLGIAMMQAGLLEKPKEGYGEIPMPSLRRDPVHVAVIQIGDSPRRLIYDDDFLWLWYNADGPEEEQS